jgi:hypothetical protein
MSSRLLHYSTSQLYWECEEDTKPEELKLLLLEIMLGVASFWDVDYISISPAIRILIMIWRYQMLEDNCGRKITLSSDRLPASFFVARLFNKKLQAQYIAALFSATLHVSLAWVTQSPHTQQDKPESDDLPSFSWVARSEKKIRWHLFHDRGVNGHASLKLQKCQGILKTCTDV